MNSKLTYGQQAAAVAALAGLFAMVAAGCGGGSSSSSGSLSVAMSDAPPNLGDVTAVNVTVTKVEAIPGLGTKPGAPPRNPRRKTYWQAGNPSTPVPGAT